MRQSTVSAMRQSMNELAALKPFSDAVRLKMLRHAAEMGEWDNIDETITNRAALMKRIKANSINGKVHIEVWQRDCDCAEWTTKVEIEATFPAYYALRMRLANEAEGPFRMTVLTPLEAASWKRESRDRALEAFENGSFYSV